MGVGIGAENSKFGIWAIRPVLQRLDAVYDFQSYCILNCKQTDKLLTFGVRSPARVGAKKPGIVAIVLEMPNNTPACLQQRIDTRL